MRGLSDCGAGYPKVNFRLLLFAAFLCAALSACSSTTLGHPAQSGFASGTSNAFGARLFVVDDVEAYLGAVRAPEDPVRIRVAHVAARGERISIFLAVTGCRPNADGECDVTADFEVRDATGALVGGQSDAPLWHSLPKPIPGTILFSELSLTLQLAGDAPLGTWEVSVVIREHESGEAVDLRATFQVVERFGRMDAAHVASARLSAGIKEALHRW